MALLGTAGFWIRGGKAALSFAAGAGISALSFWMLDRATRDLAKAAAGEPLKRPTLITHLLRLGLIFGLTYAMLGVYGADRTALVCGLLASVTAASLEALAESFYA